MCKNEKNINDLKILLANEATKILHGDLASKKAEKTAKETFEKGNLGSDLPEIKVKYYDVEKVINILDFIAKNKILTSKSEAKRTIKNKGIKINDVTVESEKKIIKLKDFEKKILKLSYGKKKHFIVRVI